MLKDTLEDSVIKMREFCFLYKQNETAVRQQIINPILIN